MSIGHRVEVNELSDTTPAHLYAILGQGDTPDLFDQPFTLDTEHDWPTGGGVTTDRRVVGIDRTLYAQVMDNEFKACGLEPEQIIAGWVRHERIEISIIIGNNAIDTYFPGHNCALAAEHEFYRMLGQDVAKIEETYWPALVACYNRPIKKPHPGMWCGPVLDNAGERDEEILEQLQKLGVKDAFKRSRYDVHYGYGQYQCFDCLNFGGKRDIELCRIVAGQVRNDRHCDFFQDQTILQMAKQEGDDKMQHGQVSYRRGKGEEFCHTCKYSDHKDAPKCALVNDISPNGWCRLWTKEVL